ncbi:odorant receptor 9a-like [Hylaeus volcanicus]|uniref:odorant receptor 9a-like n=1 Tax=Hylaeus volcanicus TaxID=313075 RepID=UPI0023B86940|nr:odorant receptor 9a-like [Hylaeus volcanicus]
MKDVAAIKLRDPLVLNEKIFSLSGVWPQQRTRILLKFTVIYLGLHVFMEYWDLMDVLGDLDMTVINILETMVATSTYLGLLIVIRRSKQLEEVIVAMKREIADDKTFENIEEKRLYMSYNIICCRFGKCATIASFVTIALMYCRPLIDLLASSDLGNGTIPYVLPFRAHLIFDYKKPPLYALVYLYQLPVTYIPMYHVAEVSFIVNTVLHLCAKLSILSYRIRNIGVKSSRSFQDGIRQSVTMHLELTRLSNTLNGSFYVILLLELMSCGFRLGLALYVVLIKISTEPVVAYNFLVHAADVAAYLYLYSYIGEQLMYESRMVGEAFYDINWPEVASNDRKALLMCMMNGQRTMYITAGKSYTFSLFGFTGIVRTSMACLSMLRAKM